MNKGEEIVLRTRQQALGDRNIIGARVEQRRRELHIKQKDLLTQLQINGVDLNASGLSKLEGQYRLVTDMELKCIAQALDVSVNWLLNI
jgi:transcriptional regulator with XRE-family HTH domain